MAARARQAVVGLGGEVGRAKWTVGAASASLSLDHRIEPDQPPVFASVGLPDLSDGGGMEKDTPLLRIERLGRGLSCARRGVVALAPGELAAGLELTLQTLTGTVQADLGGLERDAEDLRYLAALAAAFI